jgi:hypothetical protein
MQLSRNEAIVRFRDMVRGARELQYPAVSRTMVASIGGFNHKVIKEVEHYKPYKYSYGLLVSILEVLCYELKRMTEEDKNKAHGLILTILKPRPGKNTKCPCHGRNVARRR